MCSNLYLTVMHTDFARIHFAVKLLRERAIYEKEQMPVLVMDDNTIL